MTENSTGHKLLSITLKELGKSLPHSLTHRHTDLMLTKVGVFKGDVYLYLHCFPL